jgi:hypothetical protein
MTFWELKLSKGRPVAEPFKQFRRAWNLIANLMHTASYERPIQSRISLWEKVWHFST